MRHSTVSDYSNSVVGMFVGVFGEVRSAVARRRSSRPLSLRQRVALRRIQLGRSAARQVLHRQPGNHFHIRSSALRLLPDRLLHQHRSLLPALADSPSDPASTSSVPSRAHALETFSLLRWIASPARARLMRRVVHGSGRVGSDRGSKFVDRDQFLLIYFTIISK